MKKTGLMLLIMGLVFAFVSCGSSSEEKVGTAGTLPDKWWEMARGEIQNAYRGSSDGLEGQVVIFIGMSDSALNVDESTAIDNARMDAFTQLSRFLSQKVTSIQQSGRHIKAIQDAIESGSILQEDGNTLIRKVEEKMSSYNASVTSTQFSSFKQEDYHVEKVKDGNKYQAWVCYSMSDQILNETKKLQEAAFSTLMEETEEYKEIMKAIQEVIAQKMLENLYDQADLPE